jgi:polygalacturonase
MTTLIPQYDQGSTGAVNRPINQKLAEIVSVLDFGADPTGTNDSTSAFNNSITAALPKSVFVPAATYKLTGTITGKFYSFGIVTVTGGATITITNLTP